MSPIGLPASRWYRSFYFRIGASFVVFMIAVVVAQSAIVGVMMRAGGGLGPRPPNILAAIVAAWRCNIAGHRRPDGCGV